MLLSTNISTKCIILYPGVTGKVIDKNIEKKMFTSLNFSKLFFNLKGCEKCIVFKNTKICKLFLS